MKKIIAIATMAAVAATAAFAMDLSASVKTGLDVATFTSKEGSSTLEALKPTSNKDDNSFQFSVSGERAGATIKLRNLAGVDKSTTGVNTEGDVKSALVDFNVAQIWFKPFEALKVTAGTGCGVAGNGNPAGWQQIFGTDGTGVQLDVSVSGLSVTAGFNPGFGTALLKSETAGDTTTNTMAGSVYGKISYALPFGSIYGAVSGGTGGTRSAWRADKMGGSWGGNYKVGFGAGFSGNFDPLSVIVDFAGFINNADKFDDVTFDVGVKFASGDFSVAAFVPATIWLVDGIEADKKVAVGYEVKATYAIGGLTAYIDSWSGDVLGYKEDRASKLDDRIKVKPGVSGKVGDLVNWDVAVELGFAGTNNFTLNVPVTFQVSF
jgi:hypothetical protein